MKGHRKDLYIGWIKYKPKFKFWQNLTKIKFLEKT